MSIYITGDTHGTFDLRKVVYFFKGREEEFNRDDYLIICGDVGICGFSAEMSVSVVSWQVMKQKRGIFCETCL